MPGDPEWVVPHEDRRGYQTYLDRSSFYKGFFAFARGDKDLAEKWINYLLEPETQKKLTDVTDYCPAVPGTAALLTVERARNLHIDDPSYFDQLSFWAHVERLDRYLEVWNEVKAH